MSDTSSSPTTCAVAKKKREPTAFAIFVKANSQLPHIKALPGKERLKAMAAMYNEQKANIGVAA